MSSDKKFVDSFDQEIKTLINKVIDKLNESGECSPEQRNRIETFLKASIESSIRRVNIEHQGNQSIQSEPCKNRKYSDYNIWVQSEMKRVKTENPNLSHRDAFKIAAANYKIGVK